MKQPLATVPILKHLCLQGYLGLTPCSLPALRGSKACTPWLPPTKPSPTSACPLLGAPLLLLWAGPGSQDHTALSTGEGSLGPGLCCSLAYAPGPGLCLIRAYQRPWLSHQS